MVQNLILVKIDVGCWILNLKSDSTKSIDVYLKVTDFHTLGSLMILDKSNKVVSNTYSKNDIQDSSLIIRLIKSRDIKILYSQPDSTDPFSSISLNKVTMGYKSIVIGTNTYQPGTGSSGSCNHNIYCQNFSPQDFKDNVARSTLLFLVEIGGSAYFSSGCLLRANTNNDNDNGPYIYTAWHSLHVGNTWADFHTLTTLFNFSNPDCNTSSISQNPIELDSRYQIAGSTLISKFGLGDQALIKLNSNIPPHYNVYYAGWSSLPLQSPFGGAFFGIHHPQGDIKKISKATQIALQSLLAGVYKYRVFWTDGVTEKGSSGSPLINWNRRVIGCLSGGASKCNGSANFPNGPDFYGKFRNFWITSSALRNALNPNDNSFNVGTPGGEIECYANDLFLNGNYYPAKDYQPNNIITLRAQNDMYLASGNSVLIVYPNAEFNFEAGGQVIKALPGFWAQFGSTVSIKSNMSCSPMRPGKDLPEDIDSSIVYLPDEESEGFQIKNNSMTYSKLSQLKIYPNPSKGVFTLRSSTYNTNVYSISLSDVNSRIIFSQSSVYFNDGLEKSFNCEDLLPGVYILKIHDEILKEIQYKKVIIHR